MADFIRAMGFLQTIFELKINLFNVFEFSLAEMTLWFFYATLLIGSVKSLFLVGGSD